MTLNRKNNRFSNNKGRNRYNGFNHTAGRKKTFYKNSYFKDPILEAGTYKAEPVVGTLKRTERGALLLKPERSFRPEEKDIIVKQDLCRRFGLVNGAIVKGRMADVNGINWVMEVDSVNGILPEVFRFRPKLVEMPAISPNERYKLGDSGDETMRIVDLIAPIGKGTRALIVSPPKAGKTTILEKIARSVKDLYPKTHVVVLLIDERPEEVTQFRRMLPDVDIWASNNDQEPRDHVNLLRQAMEQVKVELECGGDIVVLLDSITRVGRAFNLNINNNQKTLSGGLSPNAMEIPRQFFGLARKIENGGSLTIIATALIDTGSRMDELIFQEFKGTGNCEIVLDRQLAEARIFPAINIGLSGTRHEEKLYTDADYRRLVQLRRILADESSKEATRILLELIRRYPTNKELLKTIKG